MAALADNELNEFELINELLFHLKLSENLWFPGEIEVN